MNNRIALGSNLGKSIGNGTTNRYFTTLDGTADYYTIPTVTLTGDFEIEFEFTTIQTSFKYILGVTSGYLNYFAYRGSTNAFEFKLDSGTLQTFTITGALNDGKLNKGILKRVGGVTTLTSNGVVYSEDALETNSGTYVFDYIGTNVIEALWNGTLSDVKITDGTDLIRYYKIDEDLSATSTIIDSGSDGSNGTAISITSSELFTLEGADWIGAELIVNGSFSTDTNWTKAAGWTISGGIAVSNLTSSYRNLTQTGVVLSGLKYKTQITILNYVSGDLAISIGTGGSRPTSTVYSANGTYEDILSCATPTTFQLFNAIAISQRDVDNVSVKRILQAP